MNAKNAFCWSGVSDRFGRMTNWHDVAELRLFETIVELDGRVHPPASKGLQSYQPLPDFRKRQYSEKYHKKQCITYYKGIVRALSGRVSAAVEAGLARSAALAKSGEPRRVRR